MDELLTAVWPVSFRRLCPLPLPTHARVVNHARGRSALPQRLAHSTPPAIALVWHRSDASPEGMLD